jgi:hypothetical protein
MTTPPPNRSTTTVLGRPISIRLLGAIVVALILGLLLWAKLILVTGYPRTAVATPDKNEAPRSHTVAR